ncbi:rRNA adenine N(6)-methyltransferase [Heracleum sosnowskyi]|uniref:rRNA adenine N(6)-methyltransferase n=1 Tax=Heracleum sosnowskyi TaxID=360622 RepID=A0AAD8I124_9APIA|nr:rRNA adenine N(6)-methyltransferase [Heracleum sosnowskyi]
MLQYRLMSEGRFVPNCLWNDNVKAAEKSKSKAEAKPRSQEDDYHATLKALNSKGRTPRKSLGQHYMLNSSINEQLVAAADVKEGDVVLEIGPGTGSLTNVLVESSATVLAIEKDPYMAELVTERFASVDNVKKMSKCAGVISSASYNLTICI